MKQNSPVCENAQQPIKSVTLFSCAARGGRGSGASRENTERAAIDVPVWHFRNLSLACGLSIIWLRSHRVCGLENLRNGPRSTLLRPQDSLLTVRTKSVSGSFAMKASPSVLARRPSVWALPGGLLSGAFVVLLCASVWRLAISPRSVDTALLLGKEHTAVVYGHAKALADMNSFFDSLPTSGYRVHSGTLPSGSSQQ